MRLLTTVWENGMKDSWSRINSSMHAALKLVVGSGLKLTAKDLDAVWDKFRGDYWVTGSSSDWIYSMAVEVGNVAVQEAWEDQNSFKPYRGNNVSCSRFAGGGYLHANSLGRKREKLAVGFGVPFDKQMWWVTK